VEPSALQAWTRTNPWRESAIDADGIERDQLATWVDAAGFDTVAGFGGVAGASFWVVEDAGCGAAGAVFGCRIRPGQ